MPTAGMPFLYAPPHMLPLEAKDAVAWQAEVRKQWTDSILPQRTGAALGGVTKDIVGFVPVYADCHVLVHPPHLLICACFV